MTRPGRPLLAVVYGPGSASAMKLSATAAGLCDLVWIIDSSDFSDKATTRLLRKLGTPIDIAGMSEDEAADSLRLLQPDGIVAYSDQHMVTASALAGRLGLDYPDASVTERLLDKLLQRRTMRDAGLPVPRCIVVPPSPTPEDVAALAAGMEFPVVLKPRHGAASRDTVLADDADQLARLIVTPAIGSDPTMVVEEYMVGASPPPSPHFADYVSVESVVVAGKISHVAVTGRLPQAPPFRETGLIIPNDFPRPVVKTILEVATKAISALGIRIGCLHTEIKMTNSGPRVIEVNGRIGGFVSEVLALAAPGVDLYEISQRVALGEHVVFPDLAPTDRVGFVVVEQPPLWARRVVEVEGLDRVAAHRDVDSVSLSRQAGDEVDWRKGSHEYVFSVLGAAPDHDGVRAVQQFVDEVVTVTYA